MKTRTLIDTLYGVISAVVPFSTQTLSPSNTIFFYKVKPHCIHSN